MRSTARPSRKLPKQFRTSPVKGKGEDAGKWFRCGNCGFICNIDRDSRSNTASRVGTEEFYPTTYPTEGGLQAISVLGGIGNVFVSLEQAADGSAKTISYYLKPVITGGCPLCGTKNWRGDY